MVAKQSDAVNTSNEGAAGADSLAERNAMLEAQNQELRDALVASVNAHQSDVSNIAAVTIPGVLERVEERVPVQFLRPYTFAGIPGPKGLWAMAPYDCAQGEILTLPKSEAKRLMEQEPGVARVDRGKFEDRVVERRLMAEDRHGRRQMQTVTETTSVKDLLEKARPSGGIKRM